MNFSLRFVSPLTIFLLASSTALMPKAAWTQTQDSSTQSAQTNAAAEKSTRKPDQTVTNDPIALLAVRQEGHVVSEASRGTGSMVNASAKEVGSTALPAEKKNETVASIEAQIVEKQKRVALLMRLFVDDERPFLNDPTNANMDLAIRDRRKYEQDELLYESAEIARLRARAQELRNAERKQ